jgi:hypothetical protein
MYDMPLNGDAVLVENGAVTRVNRIVRAIERNKTLADNYTSSGLTKELVLKAIDMAEQRRVDVFGPRDSDPSRGFTGRYSDKFGREDKARSPFKRTAGEDLSKKLTGPRRGVDHNSKTGKTYNRAFVKISPAGKMAIARFLGIGNAYARGIARKKGYLFGKDNVDGLKFGSKQPKRRDADGNLLAQFQMGGYETRGAGADAAYRAEKKRLRKEHKGDRAGYLAALEGARATRQDVKDRLAGVRHYDENALLGIGPRGFRKTGAQAAKGAQGSKETFMAETAKGKKLKRTVSQVLGMPQMYTKATVAKAKSMAALAGYDERQSDRLRGYANPFNGLGDVALVSNPGTGIALLDTVEGAVAKVPVVGEYVAPVIGPVALGAVGFGAHFVLVPRLRPYLPEGVLRDWAATVIGALGGVAAIAVYKMSSNTTTRNAALAVGGTVAATGIILDLNKKYGGDLGGDDYGVSPVPAGLGAVALENSGYGAVALENPGMFGAVALENPGMFGDGMAYQLSPVGFGFDGEVSALQNAYGRASAADAYFSGPDFDSAEGEALLAGAGEFGRAAGSLPRLAAGQRKHHSEFAGRRFHRWGWLIKLVGFQNAQQIAALSPEERLKVIDSLRKQALATYQQYLASAKVSETLPAGIAAGGPLAPAAAPGVGDAFGYGALAVSDY